MLIQHSVKGVEFILDELFVNAIDNVRGAKHRLACCARHHRFNLNHFRRAGFRGADFLPQCFGEIKVFNRLADGNKFQIYADFTALNLHLIAN